MHFGIVDSLERKTVYTYNCTWQCSCVNHNPTLCDVAVPGPVSLEDCDVSQFNDVYETLPADGWLTRDEAQLLHGMVASIWTPGPILEVGAYKGRSTVLLASFGRLVHVVDPFEGFSTEDPTGEATREAFWSNVDDRGIENVRLWVLRIEDFNLNIAKGCVMAYLDGDHTRKGTEAQLDAALKVNAQVIAVHDVNDTGDGLQIKQACLERLGAWTKRAGRLAVWDRRVS